MVSDAFTNRMPTPAQRQAFDYFSNLGWSPSFSAAMVATLSGESGQNLNTSPLQGNDARFGGGNGVANWSAGRWRALGAPQGLQPQLAGVAKEINSGAYRTSMGNAAALTNSTADPDAITRALTGSASSGLGYEKPLFPDPIRYRNAPHVESYLGLTGQSPGPAYGGAIGSAGAPPGGRVSSITDFTPPGTAMVMPPAGSGGTTTAAADYAPWVPVEGATMPAQGRPPSTEYPPWTPAAGANMPGQVQSAPLAGQPPAAATANDSFDIGSMISSIIGGLGKSNQPAANTAPPVPAFQPPSLSQLLAGTHGPIEFDPNPPLPTTAVEALPDMADFMNGTQAGMPPQKPLGSMGLGRMLTG